MNLFVGFHVRRLLLSIINISNYISLYNRVSSMYASVNFGDVLMLDYIVCACASIDCMMDV